MAALRFLASVFLLLAAVVLVADLTLARPGTAGGLLTSLGQHWQALAPQGMAAAQKGMQAGALKYAWSLAIRPLLVVPSWLLCLGVGLAFAYVGRRRRKVNVFVN
jgi:hypothetical protein